MKHTRIIKKVIKDFRGNPELHNVAHYKPITDGIHTRIVCSHDKCISLRCPLYMIIHATNVKGPMYESVCSISWKYLMGYLRTHPEDALESIL